MAVRLKFKNQVSEINKTKSTVDEPFQRLRKMYLYTCVGVKF